MISAPYPANRVPPNWELNKRLTKGAFIRESFHNLIERRVEGVERCARFAREGIAVGG